ncbi:CaiB/BaiF CoA transferase family protein [Camelimonas lactis]|uniref:Alpha-methylacyl-CoA racemase n=1 Tax=Camelimonas lactis TaxID=659006 RepID=A0A4R2GUZ5_9HYPH|nr:CaiB/BaiF CoA-transferase family protein [Camelimonas lactis]TCO14305.1 alpha-methylacyl-CoA racemase [Camelimonas lactis]
MSGPLAGLRVVEMAGIGPAPMAAMLLADLGATVIRIERQAPTGLGVPRPPKFNLLNRNRHSASFDLKSKEGIDATLELIEQADALIEGFRPGTMERLGLGPDVCLARNPKLVYGRMTGWGQEGPLAKIAGHDMNYLGLTGALAAIGRKDQLPSPPLNLVADYGGGALYLAFGVVSAILSARQTGEGQVVDTAMVDGAASLMLSAYGLHAAGLYSDKRGDNILDSGAPWYDVYECADGGLLAVAPIEQKFRDEFYQILGINRASLGDDDDKANWPAVREVLTAKIREKTRAEWEKAFEGSDACVSPVLDMAEAPTHPHIAARGTFIEIDGVSQPGPAPRFSRTVPAKPTGPELPGAGTEAALAEWGFSAERIADMKARGVVGNR